MRQPLSSDNLTRSLVESLRNENREEIHILRLKACLLQHSLAQCCENTQTAYFWSFFGQRWKACLQSRVGINFWRRMIDLFTTLQMATAIESQCLTYDLQHSVDREWTPFENAGRDRLRPYMVVQALSAKKGQDGLRRWIANERTLLKTSSLSQPYFPIQNICWGLGKMMMMMMLAFYLNSLGWKVLHGRQHPR